MPPRRAFRPDENPPPPAHKTRSQKRRADARSIGPPKGSLPRQHLPRPPGGRGGTGWGRGRQTCPAPVPDKGGAGSISPPQPGGSGDGGVVRPTAASIRKQMPRSEPADASQARGACQLIRQPTTQTHFPDADEESATPAPARQGGAWWAYLAARTVRPSHTPQRDAAGNPAGAESSPVCTGDLMQPGERQSRQGTVARRQLRPINRPARAKSTRPWAELCTTYREPYPHPPPSKPKSPAGARLFRTRLRGGAGFPARPRLRRHEVS